MAKTYKVVTYPANILRKKCKPIKKIDSSLEKMSKKMINTMIESNGIGLAAPQVNVPIRMIVVNANPKTNEEFMTLINPEIIKKSKKLTPLEEGCLSCPGKSITVLRPDKVSIKCQTLDGKTKQFNAEGYIAKVIQHEIDHLDGILIVDYEQKKSSKRRR